MRSTLVTATLGALLLAGCVSIGGGGKAPESLLTLTPAVVAPAGSPTDGDISNALAVAEPATPQHLNVTRVPVRVDDTSLAYLKDATWVEKPAALFKRVLAEAIRAKGERLVIGGGELDYAAPTQLSGQLLAMEYDAPSASVVVRYDAVLRGPDGMLRTQRFESTVPGVYADPASVGPALNRAANEVAEQVADWVG